MELVLEIVLMVIPLYGLSALGVVFALDRMHFKKDLTWLEALVLYDQSSLVFVVGMPFVNTAVAIAMWTHREKFDRVDNKQ